MKTLGYSESASTAWIDALLDMMRAEGDFEGGLRMEQARERLLQLMKDWQRLFVTPAGQRITEEALNGPARLLEARASGLEQDAGRFYEQMRRFLTRLEAEGSHLDMLLARLEAESWRLSVPALPRLRGWVLQDLAAGLGSVSGRHEADPETAARYWMDGREPALPQRVAELRGGQIIEGVATARREEVQLRPISHSWTVGSGRRPLATEQQQQTDTLLLQVLAEPGAVAGTGMEADIQVLAPPSLAGRPVAAARGTHQLGVLPVYIRIQFRPRRVVRRIAVPDTAAPEPIVLTPHRLSRDDFFVLDGDHAFQEGVDYDLLELERSIRPSVPMAGRVVDVRFTEFWPAYQCSLNNEDWSRPVFLDPEAPFPAGEPAPPGFELLRQADGSTWFPVTDESGHPVGSYFRLLEAFSGEVLLRVAASAGADPALPLTLELLFDRAAHVDRLHLEPRAPFPLLLDSIHGEGLVVGAAEPVFHGPALLDRAADIPLRLESGDLPYVRRLFLYLRVPSYKIKHHEVQGERQLRAAAWARASALMPRQFRRRPEAGPRRLSGLQYEAGFSSIRALRVRAADRGVLVFGPYPIQEGSRLLRLDMEASSDPAVQEPLFEQIRWYARLEYLSAAGQPQLAFPEAPETLVNPGQTMPFSDIWTAWQDPPPLRGRIWLYCVLRRPGVVLKRFYLQVA